MAMTITMQNYNEQLSRIQKASKILESFVGEVTAFRAPGVRISATTLKIFPNKRSPWFNYLKPLLTGETHIHDNQYSTSECKMFLKNAGFREVKAKRILYTPKSTPSYLLGVMKGVDFIGERMPVINEFAAIIMCRGIK